MITGFCCGNPVGEGKKLILQKTKLNELLIHYFLHKCIVYLKNNFLAVKLHTKKTLKKQKKYFLEDAMKENKL